MWLVIALILAGCGDTEPSTTPPTAANPETTQTSLPGSQPTSLAPSTSATTIPEPHWRLVAVGDSIPVGGQDCGGCEAFPQLFGEWIENTTGRTVDISNLTQHDNLTAARMAVELPQSETILDALRQADIITVTIGHNDTPWNAIDDTCDQDHGFFDGNESATWDVLVGPCLDTEVARYRKNLDAILTEITALRAGRPTAIRLTTQYADIPGDPCCPPEATKASTTIKDAFNSVACEVAAQHDVVCIDVYHAFNGPDGSQAAGPLLAPDHTHPSAAGQQRIADLLAAAGLAPLQ
jgi:lysophospholipase L1-like esterase